MSAVHDWLYLKRPQQDVLLILVNSTWFQILRSYMLTLAARSSALLTSCPHYMFHARDQSS